MIRITIDIEEYGNVEGTRECVAMALEHLGKVRIVNIDDGRSKKRNELPKFEQTRM